MIGKSFLLAGTALAVLAGGITPAAAQNITRQEYDALKARVDELEKEKAEQEERARADRTRLSTVEQQVAYAPWTFDNGRPVISSGDGRFTLGFRARFHVDGASYIQDSSDIGVAVPPAERDLGDGVVVRRARFGVEGIVFKDFQYEFTYDLGGSGADNVANIYTMRVGYVGIPNFRINLGVFKPNFTLADPTSSNDIIIMERPAVVNIAVGNYGGSGSRRAAEITYQKADLFRGGDNLLLSGAYTGSVSGSGHGTDEGTQILGRAVYRFVGDTQYNSMNIQVGVDAARILSVTGAVAPGTESIQLRERPNIRVDGQRLVDTGAIVSDGGWLWGLEGAAQFQNFMIAGEYYQFGVDREGAPAGVTDPEFSGWYIEGSWGITGEPRRYSNANAVWQAPRVIQPFSLDGNSWGAWEATVRYDVLDLDDNVNSAVAADRVRGGEQTIWTLGLNWYLNNNVRMMFNYMMVDVDRLSAAGTDRGQELDIIGTRLQFQF